MLALSIALSSAVIAVLLPWIVAAILFRPATSRQGAMRFIVAAILLCVCVQAHAESGIASVYGGSDGYCGKRVAAGGVLHCNELTAAHRTLPFGTLVKVCRVHGNCIVVTINDRGPFIRGRIIDLTPTAGRALGFSGLAHVTVDVLQLGSSHARHHRRHRHIAIRH